MSSPRLQSVLYVDDDPDICAVVQTTLCLIAGLNVCTAACGEEAIQQACSSRPDLILMDVMMPGLDGPSTFKRMRGIARIADVPVIFLTAKVLPIEVHQFLKLGAIGVIGKPFDPVKLCDDLLALWNKADAAGATASVHGDPSLVRDEVRSLTQSFLQRARDDAECLRKILERTHALDRSMLEEMRRAAHSIHGAAAIFGFSDLSLAGGAVEHLVEGALTRLAAVRSPGELTVLRQQLLDHTDRLAREVAAAGQTKSSSRGCFKTEVEVLRTKT